MKTLDWKRVVVGLLVLLVATVGFLLWRSHREAAAKEALAAEIRAERAARPRPAPRAPTAEEAETARLYTEALSKFQVDYSETAYFDALDEAPWSEVPKPVADMLSAYAETLALVDEAAARESCRFDEARLPSWSGRWQVRRLLFARGHAALAAGDPIAAAEEVGRLLRVGRHFGAGPRPGESDWDGVWPGLQQFAAEQDAAGLLSALATAPGLPPEAGPALLDSAAGPWGTADTHRRGIDEHLDANDATLLQLLAPDARARLDKMDAGIAEFDSLLEAPPPEQSLLDRAKDRFRKSVRPRTEVPTAEGLREFRRMRAPIVAALRRRDMVELAPGGPHDAIGGLFGLLGPRWFRLCVTYECRIAVARAAAAIRAFQLREGRPPPALQDLDPLDGKPLRYESEGEGWLVGSRVWIAEDDPPVEIRFPRPSK